ncbi:MAG: phosphate signaling complex protein PhoU [Elusimicrobia bacterium]|nr:phosphate signaling complex protein PhoU [Elusimicrobiota bacterium]
MLDDKLVGLKKELIDFAAVVESMVEKCLKGLMGNNPGMYELVIATDEPRANAYEIAIDEICTNLLAQYQPRAKNLRLVLMIYRMSNDLERMADHAVNIAESARYLSDRSPVKPLVDLPHMGELTVRMLSDSINAFVNEDAALARSVCARDNEVDDLKRHILSELTTIMKMDPTTVERALQIIRITGNLERIADLSTNICEEVLFLAEGRVIKHHMDEHQ